MPCQQQRAPALVSHNLLQLALPMRALRIISLHGLIMCFFLWAFAHTQKEHLHAHPLFEEEHCMLNALTIYAGLCLPAITSACLSQLTSLSQAYVICLPAL